MLTSVDRRLSPEDTFALGIATVLLKPLRVPELMREGRITSRSEHGEGEDEGRYRLTFWHERTTLRLVVQADGTVIGQSRIVGAPPR